MECGWICSADTAHEWVHDTLHNSLKWFDLPLLLRLHQAAIADNVVAFSQYSTRLMAGRETSELRDEESHRARALYRVLSKLPEAQTWEKLHDWQHAVKQTQAAGFALACTHWSIDAETMLRGYVWCWLENMVSVLVKLVPLGQTAGQCIVFELSEALDAVVRCAMQVQDADIGSSAAALAIASSLHETQYCRLFRS